MLYCLPDFIHNYRSLLRSPLQPSRRPFTMTVSYPFQVSSQHRFSLSFSLCLFSSLVLPSPFARQAQSVRQAVHPPLRSPSRTRDLAEETKSCSFILARSVLRQYRPVQTHAIRVEGHVRMRVHFSSARTYTGLIVCPFTTHCLFPPVQVYPNLQHTAMGV